MVVVEQWLIKHPFFEALSANSHPKNAWAIYAEAAAPLIYSVPAFLGVTLARTDQKSREILNEVWAEELGIAENLSHPVLFQKLHHYATSQWGRYPHLHKLGISTGTAMVELCDSGNWPIGVAAMLAHESQFPAAYANMVANAEADLGENAAFFQVHAHVDIEHTATSTNLLEYALSAGIATEAEIEASYTSSAQTLKLMFDNIWRAVNESHAAAASD